MAGVKASALLLWRVCTCSESMGRSFAANVCLVLKRPERKGPYGTEVYDSAGAERLTGLSFETAGENLQDDVVLIRLVLLGLRILVFLPLAFIAAEET